MSTEEAKTRAAFYEQETKRISENADRFEEQMRVLHKKTQMLERGVTQISKIGQNEIPAPPATDSSIGVGHKISANCTFFTDFRRI